MKHQLILKRVRPGSGLIRAEYTTAWSQILTVVVGKRRSFRIWRKLSPKQQAELDTNGTTTMDVLAFRQKVLE